MAEFVEVMRQALRMCVTVNDCDQCELMTDAGCRFAIFADDAKYSHEIEQIVMDWAAANPELRYPTWEEWQRANFPNAGTNLCPMAFGIINRSACIDISCGECTNKPITADIAEKLGVKPMGGVNDV